MSDRVTITSDNQPRRIGAAALPDPDDYGPPDYATVLAIGAKLANGARNVIAHGGIASLDTRLALSADELVELAPVVAEWLQNHQDESQIRDTRTAAQKSPRQVRGPNQTDGEIAAEAAERR